MTLFSGNHMYSRGEAIPDDLPLIEAMKECGSICTEEEWAEMQMQESANVKATAEALPAGIEAASSTQGNAGELLVGVPKKGRQQEKK
nr:MAG TPA: hypothetical protein [Caudoviricetes sp.]